MKKLKVTYLTTAQVAEILGYTTNGARLWLIRHDAAIRDGRFWVTTPSRLAAAFPEAFQSIAHR